MAMLVTKFETKIVYKHVNLKFALTTRVINLRFKIVFIQPQNVETSSNIIDVQWAYDIWLGTNYAWQRSERNFI